MLPPRHRITDLPPDLAAEVLRLLAEDTRDSRLRALQLLTSAWESDEEQRRARDAAAGDAAGDTDAAAPEGAAEDG